jgi:hypothetical protein
MADMVLSETCACGAGIEYRLAEPRERWQAERAFNERAREWRKKHLHEMPLPTAGLSSGPPSDGGES